MFETYIANGKICSWEVFKAVVQANPDLPFSDGKKRITSKEYIKFCKPQLRLRKIKFIVKSPLSSYSQEKGVFNVPGMVYMEVK